MGKYIDDSVMDAGLNVIKSGATAMHVCTTIDSTPTRAEVLAASLANVAMTSGDFTGPADGTTSGRKLTTVVKNGVAIGTSGTAVNVCIIDGTKVLAVTDCTSQSLTSGNTVNIPAWVVDEIADAT
jgi:hypothetical protein